MIAIVSLISRQASQSNSKPSSEKPSRSASQQSSQPRDVATVDSGAVEDAARADVDTSIGFRTQAKYDSHYKKHGREFGSISQAEYLRIAQTLRDSPVSDRIVEAKQARGGLARFDRTTGTFMAFDDDKTILTCFKPDDGEAYFNRSIKRKV